MPGEAATTANNIIANEPLFRFGAASWLIVLLFDTVIAWALYVFLKPVNKSGSLLAALFRLVYVAIFASVLVNLFSALQLLSGVDYMTVFETGQLQAQLCYFLMPLTTGSLLD